MNLKLSDNLKTGRSINLDHGSCRPDEMCSKLCYGRYVGAEEAKKWGIKANAGPITWRSVRKRYRENRVWLEQASDAEIATEAVRLHKAIRRAGLRNVRLCGMGDLTPGLVKLAAELQALGIHPWAFSKKPEMIRMLARRAPGASCIASVNLSTPRGRVQRMMAATETLMGQPTLAHMTQEPGWIGAQEVDNLWYREAVVVVFGHHVGQSKTEVWHPLACPATNGQDIHCQECQRCINDPRSRPRLPQTSATITLS
jgi:hypothetical protein